MAEKPKPKKSKAEKQKDQSERFKETARKLGADESGEAMEIAFKKIVPTKSGH